MSRVRLGIGVFADPTDLLPKVVEQYRRKSSDQMNPISISRSRKPGSFLPEIAGIRG
jgi:hypothetical protein